MRDPVEQFRDALQHRNIISPATISYGKMDRADVDDKHGRNDASYIYFPDGIPAGGFENHRDGLGWETWKADAGRDLSAAEQKAQREQVQAARRERDVAVERRRAEAARTAAAVWKAATPAKADHPYLARKNISPVATLREINAAAAVTIMGYHPKSDGESLIGRLLVVPIKVGDKFSTLEFIDEAGRKAALAGGAKAGGYWAAQALPEGDGAGMTLLLGEGVATVLSAMEATGQDVVATLSCGNLGPVARALRERYPTARLIVLADLGIGLPAAEKAARAVGGLLAVPAFGTDGREGATDFNDLAMYLGHEAVRRAIADAKAPDVAPSEPTPPNAPGADTAGEKWPAAMDDAAMHGIAGEFVRMVEPNTESDPAAILVQFLVAFGALVGRGPHFRVEGDEHHANLFVVLGGRTSKARKGTDWGRVRQPFELIVDANPNNAWKPHVSGLSTGEGLKYNVRDATETLKKNKAGEMEMEITDQGVTDKRLLVIEAEFGSVLRVGQRQGSTLSATIRESWDTGNLRTLTKNDPITATGAHICIIGHITRDELRKELTATDAANGFANRFLYVAVKRSKFLPLGGDKADWQKVLAFASRIKEKAELARTRDSITMTDRAKALWTKVYPVLSEGSDGLHGAVTARAEAQVVRLALVYCLLDGAEQIDVPHLMAALAVWSYCDATAKYVFGASLGDPDADQIMRQLILAGANGMTRTEISDHFKRHLTADKLDVALEMLQRKGLATVESVKTGGRPVEVWRAVK